MQGSVQVQGKSARRKCLDKLCNVVCRCNPTAISLKAGCELFLRYTTRTSAIENEDFATAKARIIEVSYSVKACKAA